MRSLVQSPPSSSHHHRRRRHVSATLTSSLIIIAVRFLRHVHSLRHLLDAIQLFPLCRLTSKRNAILKTSYAKTATQTFTFLRRPHAALHKRRMPTAWRRRRDRRLIIMLAGWPRGNIAVVGFPDQTWCPSPDFTSILTLPTCTLPAGCSPRVHSTYLGSTLGILRITLAACWCVVSSSIITLLWWRDSFAAASPSIRHPSNLPIHVKRAFRPDSTHQKHSHTAGPLTFIALTNASSVSILCKSQAAAVFGSYGAHTTRVQGEIDAVERAYAHKARVHRLCIDRVFKPRCIRSDTPDTSKFEWSIGAIVNNG